MSALGQRWRASRRLRAGVIVAIAVVTVALTWYPSPAPGVGFDPSWQIGLHLIADRGLDFGDQVAFTYGPLGFLLFPQVVTGGTWATAFLVTLGLRVALVTLVIGATRRATGRLLPGVVIGYLCAAALGPLVTIPGLLAGLAALVLVQRPLAPSGPARLVPWALGGYAAVCLLMKLDAGLVAAVTLGIAAWFQPPARVRALAAFCGGYVATFALAWTATGNDLRDVPRWLDWSAQMVGGYSGGATLTDARVAADWHGLVVAGCLAAGAALLALSMRRAAPGRRVALGLTAAVLCWTEVKHGFVRHDTHVAGTLLAVGLVPLTVRWERRRWSVAAVAVAAVGAVGALNAMNLDVGDRLAPDGTRALAREGRMLVDDARRDRAGASARAAARRRLAIDPSIVDLIGQTPVHVAPQETSVIWAVGLRWNPEPQFQSFSTWTAGLDRINAAHLTAADGPRLVLRQSVARLDHHNPLWESPRENLALLCDFRRRRFVGRWELLERAPTRCGPERALGTTRPDGDGWVRVPAAAPGELVYARIDFSPGIVERLRSLALRPGALPSVELPRAPSRVPYRIPGALADGPLVVTIPAGVDLPPRLRALAVNDRMRLRDMPGARVAFFARPIASDGSVPESEAATRG